mmetsp:Transcript_36389/g.85083  ORF Transcript_36389/g.85083 Transcript_36389/m.85083 type:complete len:375 (+) Transcript_36389:329-1453(+)
MKTQVGGIAKHKEPMRQIRLPSKTKNNAVDVSATPPKCFALKPLRMAKPAGDDAPPASPLDHRSYKELAFYEALDIVRDPSLDDAASAPERATEPPTPSRKGPRITRPCDDQHTRLVLLLETTAPHLSTAESPPDRLASSNSASRDIVEEIHLLRALSVLTSKYYGVFAFRADVPPSLFLVIENATAGFSVPCVMDLKVGTNTYAPDATVEKKRNEIAKYPLQSTMGFRIVGMQIHATGGEASGDQERGIQTFDKKYGTSLVTMAQVENAMRMFFLLKMSHRTTEDEIIKMQKKLHVFLSKLSEIIQWFERNHIFKFYSSSLLIAHEGDMTISSDDVVVKLIDFAHVRRLAGKDIGYMKGLSNLNQMIKRILSN